MVGTEARFRAIEEVKRQARLLHREVAQALPVALARVRRVPELAALQDAMLVRSTRRRHCLSLLARELGFGGWPHLSAVLQGRRADDFGTLLYPPCANAHWNIWSASYGEARDIRAAHGGYLLAYKHHYFIVDRHFIETLALDPEDPDWERMARDWVRPASLDARDRLYWRLIRQHRPRASVS